ncbi:MAG: hypothetical protein ACOCZE_10460 [Planctomycetota bacterium]
MRSNIRNTTYGLAGWARSTRSLLCAAVLVSILAGMSPAQDGILPLVPADDELAAFLDKARQRIEEKDYENAITYLNALIQRTDAGFYRVKKTRRYLPIRHGATELLGTMPDEGLEQYRKLYDPQAYQLYLEARQAGDLGLLRQVADRYANTSYGPVALETLAEMSFDRGMYTQATWFWQQVRDKTDPSDNPLMLAKLAVAAHLSGQDKLFGEVRKDLAARHPDASARVGRTQRNLVEFVDWAGKNLTVEVAKAGRASAGWPGLWSMPGQIGLMDDADVVLIPRWSTASDDMVGKDDAGEYLVALSAEIKKADTTRRSNSSTEVKLEQGHVLLESRQGNRRETGILPAMIHPIVVGEWVIHRNDRRIVAHDAYTGEKAWESIEFPLVRDMPTNSSGRHYYSYYYGRDVMDTGRYSLSVGGTRSTPWATSARGWAGSTASRTPRTSRTTPRSGRSAWIGKAASSGASGATSRATIPRATTSCCGGASSSPCPPTAKAACFSSSSTWRATGWPVWTATTASCSGKPAWPRPRRWGATAGPTTATTCSTWPPRRRWPTDASTL